MRKERNYINDITEMRSMMERSTKFLSLSGLSGIMAGTYALLGAWIAYHSLGFNPGKIIYTANSGGEYPNLLKVVLLSVIILVLAIGTAIFLSYISAGKKNEKVWNATSRRLVINMAVPLFTGGILILILISKGLIGLIAPFSLLFYGLAFFSAGKFTYDEMKFFGLIQMGLGLLGCYFVEYGLLFWAIGFGVFHIIYGIYMYFRYEQ